MNKQKIFEIANYIFFSLVIIVCLVLTIVLKLDWWAFVTCATTILYFVFLSHKNILNAVLGLLSSAAYIVVAYKLHLYGEVIYYLAFDIPATIVSFILWLKHRESKLKVKTRSLKWYIVLAIAISSCLAVVGYAQLLKYLGGANVWLDSLVAVLALVSALLVMFRCREQWAVWIVLYIAGVTLYVTTFDLLMLIMCCSCLLSSIIGFIVWHKNNKNVEWKNDGKKHA